MESNYPALSRLIRCYFNEDFDLWGDTIPEIIACYKLENNAQAYRAVLNDIENFRRENSRNLDETFKEMYKYHFDSEPWGHTTQSFLDEVQKLLQQ